MELNIDTEDEGLAFSGVSICIYFHLFNSVASAREEVNSVPPSL